MSIMSIDALVASIFLYICSTCPIIHNTQDIHVYTPVTLEMSSTVYTEIESKYCSGHSLTRELIH